MLTRCFLLLKLIQAASMLMKGCISNCENVFPFM